MVMTIMAGYYSDYHFLATNFFLLFFKSESKELVEAIILMCISLLKNFENYFFFIFENRLEKRAGKLNNFFSRKAPTNHLPSLNWKFFEDAGWKKISRKNHGFRELWNFFRKFFFDIYGHCRNRVKNEPLQNPTNVYIFLSVSTSGT